MMMFGLSAKELEAAGAQWTAREVLQQPAVWAQIETQMAAEAQSLADFLNPLLARREVRIVLTGAGTSAYIGECLAPALTQLLDRRVDAIPTTDLVSSPPSYLSHTTPTLLVSFGRSGNSPESVAAVHLADALIKDCAHLIITCDAEGALAQVARKHSRARVVVLPERSNDRSFAMTSSFTGMLLTAALLLGATRGSSGASSSDSNITSSKASRSNSQRGTSSGKNGNDDSSTSDSNSRRLALDQAASRVLPETLPYIKHLVGQGFDRVVYLGSKEFKGLAREAALKMLELTDGKVVALADSPLGFRHGPKTILNAQTLVIVFVGNDPYSRQYDWDLVNELRRDGVAGRVVTLSARPLETPHEDDVLLGTTQDAAILSDLELCLPYAIFAQSMALLRSLSLGIRPDNPNAAGTVSRVVKGVSIHPWRDGV
jgi:tagatose-6-phosphate ketose/aldose isomerase